MVLTIYKAMSNPENITVTAECINFIAIKGLLNINTTTCGLHSKDQSEITALSSDRAYTKYVALCGS